MMKGKAMSLEKLWRSSKTGQRPSQPPSDLIFAPESFADRPPLARRYLERAIAPGTPLATTVRLRMHGTIKLGQNWHRFQGEEVISWQRGMIWRATAWMQGLPIRGADYLVEGVGQMQWKLLGLIPVMQASGPDISRSGAGRMQAEAMWLPSVLCDPEVDWVEANESQLQASFTALGEPAKLILTVDAQGAVQQEKLDRWGNPDGGDYRYVGFGAIVEATGTFGGYTIPTQLRVGWFFGSDRFEPEGEFFRCTVDQAIYR